MTKTLAEQIKECIEEQRRAVNNMETGAVIIFISNGCARRMRLQQDVNLDGTKTVAIVPLLTENA